MSIGGRVCHPRRNGRLGFKEIRVFNLALLVKWIWKLGIARNGLWFQIVEDKNYSRGLTWDVIPPAGMFVVLNLERNAASCSSYTGFGVG